MMIDKKIVKNRIVDLINGLLDDSKDELEIKDSIDVIYNHFKDITTITGYDQNLEYLMAIPAAKGKALGLNYAAQCLLDYNRTQKFLKSIVRGILEKQKKKQGELVNVFYAGCGPYATLMTLVAPYFKKSEVKFTLLEINKNSLDSAKKLIDYLGLSNFIREYYLEDAITFKVPSAITYDIVISETLDALLYRECYVPILFNLLPQFNKNVTLIPENVLIDMSLIKDSEESEIGESSEFTNILDVRKELLLIKQTKDIPSKLAVHKIDLKSLNTELYKKIILDTKVHIYNDIWLKRNESSLTLPFEIEIDNSLKKESIEFTYFIEPEIELKCVIK